LKFDVVVVREIWAVNVQRVLLEAFRHVEN
jgi:hypothetical protein